MTRSNDLVFVDTGAWIALALTRDPLHDRARAAWEGLLDKGSRLATSIPVVLETWFIARSGDCEGNGVAAAPGAGKALRASSASLRPYG